MKYLFILTLLLQSAHAEVLLPEGIFYVVYQDLGIGPWKMERVYHSNTNRPGYFGKGWGSNLETYLQEKNKNEIRTEREKNN